MKQRQRVRKEGAVEGNVRPHNKNERTMRIQNLWGEGKKLLIFLVYPDMVTSVQQTLGQATTHSWSDGRGAGWPKGWVCPGAGKSQEAPVFSRPPHGILQSLGKDGAPSVSSGQAARMVRELRLQWSWILHLISRKIPAPEVNQPGAGKGGAWLIWKSVGYVELWPTWRHSHQSIRASPGRGVDTWKNVDVTPLPFWFVTSHFNSSSFLIVKLSRVPLSYFCLGAYKERCQFSSAFKDLQKEIFFRTAFQDSRSRLQTQYTPVISCTFTPGYGNVIWKHHRSYLWKPNCAQRPPLHQAKCYTATEQRFSEWNQPYCYKENFLALGPTVSIPIS